MLQHLLVVAPALLGVPGDYPLGHLVVEGDLFLLPSGEVEEVEVLNQEVDVLLLLCESPAVLVSISNLLLVNIFFLLLIVRILR